MTLVSLDPRYPTNRKVAKLSDAAFRLDVSAICYATKELTDGLIELEIAHWLASPRATDGIFTVQDDRRLLIEELVHAGRWDVTAEGDFLIHDFAQYQETTAKVAQRRERWRRQKSSAKNPRGIRGDSARNSGLSHARVDGVEDPASVSKGRGPTAVAADAADGLPFSVPALNLNLERFQPLAAMASDADEGTLRTWAIHSAGLPEAAIARAGEALRERLREGPLRSPAGYVTATLKRMRDEGQYA